LIGVGGGGRGEAWGANQGEEGASGAEGGVVVTCVELAAEDVDGFKEREADAVREDAPDLVLAAGEFFDEGRVLVLPGVEGLAVDAEGGADLGVGLAHDDQGEGGELFGGERAGGVGAW
jgi:hypothetical protein